jgi:hypothetical protein
LDVAVVFPNCRIYKRPRQHIGNVCFKTLVCIIVFYINYGILVPKLLLNKKGLLYAIIVIAGIAVFAYVFSKYDEPPMFMRQKMRMLLPPSGKQAKWRNDEAPFSFFPKCGNVCPAHTYEYRTACL